MVIVSKVSYYLSFNKLNKQFGSKWIIYVLFENLNMGLLYELITLLILIIKISNQLFTVLYLVTISDQIMYIYNKILIKALFRSASM